MSMNTVSIRPATTANTQPKPVSSPSTVYLASLPYQESSSLPALVAVTSVPLRAWFSARALAMVSIEVISASHTLAQLAAKVVI